MARVTMIQNVSGTRDGADWPPVGADLEVPADEAEQLVALGLAEAFKPAPKKAAAPAAKAEKATARTGEKR